MIVVAPAAKRCIALHSRTGKRCKAYRWNDYAYCTRHLQQAQHGHLGILHHDLRASGTHPRYQQRG